MNKTYFISDIHLQASEPKMAKLFMQFLMRRCVEADALYILGDLFEVWVGDDNDTPFHRQIIAALHQLSSQIPVYYLHGNRDFLIGKRFLNASGCQLLKDPCCVDLYGTKTLLTHGDLLCTRDTRYQRFRRYSRCWIIQKLFLLKSLKKRKQIAERYRAKSHQHTSTAPEHIMDVTPGMAEKYLQQYHAPLMIHGHTHRPNIHQLDNQLTRVVLGAWHERGNVLVCKSDSNHKLNYKLVFFDKDELGNDEIF